jgi:hypothetical protein
MHHGLPWSMSMLVLYIAKHVCLSVRLKSEWEEIGGANIETMASKDVIGVHLLLKEQVKTMINAINTDLVKSERKSGTSSIYLCFIFRVFRCPNLQS